MDRVALPCRDRLVASGVRSGRSSDVTTVETAAPNSRFNPSALGALQIALRKLRVPSVVELSKVCFVR